MSLIKRTMKRSLAIVLVLTMLLSVMNFGMVISANAVRSAETVSYGQLLADNVEELGDAEKSILRSGLLSGGFVTYQSPDNSDNLITVDPENKKISVSPYTDEQGNVWTVAECRVVYDGGSENVVLTGGEGTFIYAGDAYSVEADYKLAVPVENPTMTEKLLNAPYWLAKGVDNLNVLCSSEVQASLDVLAQHKDLLQKAADGYDIYGQGGAIIAHVDLPCKSNAQNLLNQCNNNDGKLDLKVKGDECKDSSSKVAYIINSGNDIKNSAEETYVDVQAIYADLSNKGYQSAMIAYGITTQEMLDTICNSLDPFLKTVEAVVEDSWTILDNTDVLKDGLTSEQYVYLDGLLAADESLANKTFEGTVPSVLDVKTVTVESSMNRYTVTVQVAAQVVDRVSVDTDETVDMPMETVTFKMKAGSTGTDILAQVDATGVEARALAGWDPFYAIDETNYVRSVSAELNEEYTLDSDVTYTITYTPRTMTLTYGQGYAEDEKTPETVPFGYQMTLPRYDGDQVYDYTVNGNSADQGDVIRITGETAISRVSGKAWESHSIGKLISANYAIDDTTAQDILTSSSLKTGTFRLRTPSNEDGLLSLSIDSTTGTYTVTAKAYKANTADLWWIPESATLTGGADDGTEIAFTSVGDRNYTATFDSSLGFDRVTVNYRVTLSWEVLGISAKEALDVLNLPYVLTTDAKDQLSSMETLNEQYSNFETLNQNLNGIWMSVNGSDLPTESKDAMKDLLDNCQNADGTLYLYQYLSTYRTLGTDGEKLAFYYRNYDGVTGIKAQVDRICKCFKVVAVDNRDSFVDFLKKVKYDQYVSKIDQIYSALTGIQSSLKAPNAAINITSAGLNDLAALTVKGIDHTKEYSGTLENPVLDTNLYANAPDKISVTIDIQIQNSDGDIIKEKSGNVSFTTEGGKVKLTAEQAALLCNLENELYESVFASQSDKDHYQNSTSDDIPVAGDTLTESVHAKVVYRPTVYIVNFEDSNGNSEGSISFPFDKPTISLPVSEEDGMRNDYSIDGAWVNGTYTFTVEQIDRLFVEKSYTVVRKAVDISREKIEQLVDNLNNAIVEAGLTFRNHGRDCLIVAFIPVELDGNLSIVMRISPNNNDNYEKALQNVGQVLVNTSLSYIEIDGGVLKADNQLHLQGLLDALLNSGAGLHTIENIIDTNGDIVETTIAGDPIGVDDAGLIPVGSGVINDPSLWGAKLMQTSLILGSSKESGTTVPFYMTMEDFDREAGNLKKVRDAAHQARQYVELTADNGRLNLELKLNDRMYQAVVSAMLAANLVDVEDIANIDPVEVVHYLYDIVKTVPLDKQITGATLNNTLGKLGVNVDLSVYDKIGNVLRNLINNSSILDESGQTDTYLATIKYDLNALIEKMDMGALAGMIAESKSGIDIPVGVKVDNLNKAYKAVVIDYKAAGAGKLRYYSSESDLQNALNNLASTGVVILLSDIDGDLEINTQEVLLNLNGKTVDGSITANAKTIILDSSSNNVGGVSGNVSGNVTVTAGNYANNISEFLPAGYRLEGEKVVNDLYLLSYDSDGNLTVTFNGDMLKMEKKPSIRSLAMELAADVIIKHFTSASMAFDNYTLYSVAVNDLVDIAANGVHEDTVNDLLACIDTEGITGFANDLIDVLTDFEAMSTAMEENDGILKTYTMETGSWTIALERIEDGNYLTASILPTSDKEIRSVSLKIQDNANGEFAALVNRVKDVVSIDADITLNKLIYANQSVSVSGSGRVDAVINFNNDPDYAAALAVIMTNQTDGDLKANLVEALRDYSNTGRTKGLKEAIEALTTAQLVDALKNMKRDTFADTISKLGLTGLDNVKELEAAYDDLFVLVGDLASALKLKGGNRTIGSYANSYACYDLSRDLHVKQEGKVNLAADAKVHVIINLLNPDPEYAVEVKDSSDASVYCGNNLMDAFAAIASDGYTICVYQDVQLEEDVNIPHKLTIKGASRIDLNGHRIVLTDIGASVITDADLAPAVVSGQEGYEVSVVNVNGKYTYTLTAIVAPIPDIQIIYSDGTSTGYSDLVEAFANVKSGCVLRVNNPVDLNSNVSVSANITVSGADKISLNGHKISLDMEAARISSDADLSEAVVSGVWGYKLNTEGTVYSLRIYAVTVYDSSNTGICATDDLNEAFDKAENGITIYVNLPVTLKEDVTISSEFAIYGTYNIDQNGKSILLAIGGKLKTDATLNVTTKEAYYKVVRDNDTYVLLAVAPTLTDSVRINAPANVVNGYKINVSKGLIMLDVEPSQGITKAQLEACVTVGAENASRVTYSVSGLSEGRVINGAILTVTASNTATSKTDIAKYTIIIMGDTNCNGRTDSGDAVVMMRNYLYGSEMSEAVKLAADMNQNGRIDSGDAVKNSTKYTYLWEKGSYITSLK